LRSSAIRWRGSVDEDICERIEEGGDEFGVKLLAIGIDWEWIRKSGDLRPIQRTPKTTHEIMSARHDAARVRLQEGISASIVIRGIAASSSRSGDRRH
jgi:microsomal dipeptidase-like Zn-dependent dipeptidase